MGAENQLFSIGPEQTSYSNIRTQLVVGTHSVSTEKGYIKTRERIEEMGVKFFQRGFNNFILMEEASGKMFDRRDIFNTAAKDLGSYRTAYWNIGREFSEQDARHLTQLFERKPVERFIHSGRMENIDDSLSAQTAFTYASLAALDNIVRKGYATKLIGEQRSKVRWEVVPPSGENLRAWKEMAKQGKEMDQELASQMVQLAAQYPSRTRIMGLFGTGHASIRDHLPSQLYEASEVVYLLGNESVDPFVIFFRNIQSGSFTDEQLEEQLSELRKTKSRVK